MKPFAIKIVRQVSVDTGTPGLLTTSADAPFTCSTLELEWQNNRTGVSCIIADTRMGKLWYSPTLKRMVVRLDDAHGRKDVLLHNANFAGLGDGECAQIHGCTAIGQGYGKLQNPQGHMQFAVLNSGNTLDKLIAHIQANTADGASFPVTYAWDAGCEPADLTDLNGKA
jgi:hypothetical protein